MSKGMHSGMQSCGLRAAGKSGVKQSALMCYLGSRAYV